MPMTSRTGRLVGLGALALLLCGSAAAQDAPGAESRDLARGLYQDLVNIPSSRSRGGTREIAAYVARRMEAGGFDAGEVTVAGPRQDNLGVVVRYRGKGNGRPVIMMAHMDVVEALREDWEWDPFTFLEKDGYYYGRGTSDNKAGMVVMMANFLRLKQEGHVPERDLYMVLTGDEETEMESIRFLLEQLPELVRAEFALNTDGGYIDLQEGEPNTFVVQAAEKVYLTWELQVTNPGGHSSVPRSDNAIYQLARGLVNLGEFRFPISLNPVTEDYFRQAARFQPEEKAAAMQALADGSASADQVGLLTASPYYNAMLRTTCVATQLHGGHAENALPQVARAVVNCRLLPQDSPAQVEATLRRVLDDEQIQMTVVYPAVASPPSELTPAVRELVGGVVQQMYPGLPVMAQMSTGATDGLHTRNLGIPTYGVSALGRNADDSRAHGKNERVGVEQFHLAVAFWYRLISSL